MASPEERLLDELNNVIVSFLCDSGSLEVERCSGAHVFSRGSSQPLCTVKLRHGQIYHLEFVYKFLAFKLKNCNYPSSPVFVISNNGLATTLRCFLHEPSGLRSGQSGPCLGLSTDVDLPKNSIIMLGQDDFIKFKSPLVFPAELDLLKSMVVCRAYITEHRTTMQFLVFQAANAQKASRVMDMISDMSQQLSRSGQVEDTGARVTGGGGPLIAPSAYARLNLLNHCIFLEAFKEENSGQGLGGVQREVLFLKRDIIKQVIARIVAADSTLDLVNHGEPGREAQSHRWRRSQA